MIFDILKDSLEYVGTNRKQIIIYYLGILIFPLILIESYSYHIIENCLNGMINNKDELPDIIINSETFIKGIKLLVLKIIYCIPEILVIIVAMNLPQNNYYYLTAILLILTILSYSISQIASVCMVDAGEFKEGFNFTKIINILKTVGVTYIELLVASLIILLGIIGVTILLTGIVMLFSGINSLVFTIILTVIAILYVVFLIIIIPLYVLFKNRSVVSVYNLS